IVVSPIAGALLDRHGRVRLIMLDYAVGALSLFLIGGLDAAGRMTPAVLLPIVTLGALTYSLSNSGARSLLPLIVPSRLWDRANALDSMAYAVTGAAGPALAGALTAGFGPRVALLTSAAFFVAGGLAVAGLSEPPARGGTTSVLAEAREGLLYVVVRNASLRGLHRHRLGECRLRHLDRGPPRHDLSTRARRRGAGRRAVGAAGARVGRFRHLLR